MHGRRHLRRFREQKAGGEYPSQWLLQHNNLHLCTKGIQIDVIKSSGCSSSGLLPYRTVDRSETKLCHDESPYRGYSDDSQLSSAVARTLTHDYPNRAEHGDLLDIAWVHWDRVEQEPRSNHIFEVFSDVSDQWRYFDRFRQTDAQFAVFGFTCKLFLTHAWKEDLVSSSVDDRSHMYPIYGFRHTDCVRPLGTGDLENRYTNHHASNLRRSSVALQNRRLITIRTGFLGLAPNEVRIGDIVAILLGCTYPVLLRPFEDGFKNIGGICIDGLMNGEAIEAAPHGDYEVQDILIL